MANPEDGHPPDKAVYTTPFYPVAPKLHLPAEHPEVRRFRESYPNGLPYGMTLAAPSERGIPERYIEDNIPLVFYATPPDGAKAIFSTGKGSRPFQAAWIIPQLREISIINARDIQKECNLLRKMFFEDVMRMPQPRTWQDLWDYFDGAELVTRGAQNMWNIICHLYHENTVIEEHDCMVRQLNVGMFVDGWLAKPGNMTRLRRWDGARDIMTIFSFRDWHEIHKMNRDEWQWLRQALVYRHRLFFGDMVEFADKVQAQFLLEAKASGTLHQWLAALNPPSPEEDLVPFLNQAPEHRLPSGSFPEKRSLQGQAASAHPLDRLTDEIANAYNTNRHKLCKLAPSSSRPGTDKAHKDSKKHPRAAATEIHNAGTLPQESPTRALSGPPCNTGREPQSANGPIHDPSSAHSLQRATPQKLTPVAGANMCPNEQASRPPNSYLPCSCKKCDHRSRSIYVHIHNPLTELSNARIIEGVREYFLAYGKVDKVTILQTRSCLRNLSVRFEDEKSVHEAYLKGSGLVKGLNCRVTVGYMHRSKHIATLGTKYSLLAIAQQDPSTRFVRGESLQTPVVTQPGEPRPSGSGQMSLAMQPKFTAQPQNLIRGSFPVADLSGPPMSEPLGPNNFNRQGLSQLSRQGLSHLTHLGSNHQNQHSSQWIHPAMLGHNVPGALVPPVPENIGPFQVRKNGNDRPRPAPLTSIANHHQLTMRGEASSLPSELSSEGDFFTPLESYAPEKRFPCRWPSPERGPRNLQASKRPTNMLTENNHKALSEDISPQPIPESHSMALLSPIHSRLPLAVSSRAVSSTPLPPEPETILVDQTTVSKQTQPETGKGQSQEEQQEDIVVGETQLKPSQAESTMIKESSELASMIGDIHAEEIQGSGKAHGILQEQETGDVTPADEQQGESGRAEEQQTKNNGTISNANADESPNMAEPKDKAKRKNKLRNGQTRENSAQAQIPPSASTDSSTWPDPPGALMAGGHGTQAQAQD